jgi:tRNA-dihydrouridine synthase
MIDETNCDAVMIARAAIGNPWFIHECVEFVENNNIIDKPTYKERIDILVKHYNLLEKNVGERKALLDIKTHALAYLKYIPGSKELKNEFALYKTKNEFDECIKKAYKLIEKLN